MSRDVHGRFWSKVCKTDTCWLWTPPPDPYGYGRFRVSGRQIKAHRFSYEALVGPIPDGLDLDHLCRVRACVNPSHLEPVTRKTNSLRGNAPVAINARKTHCVNGHEFTPENTRVYEEPRRRTCRACDRARQAEYIARKRAKAAAARAYLGEDA